MLDNEKVGKNILGMRKGLSLTQVELSNLLGVSHQAVSKWEQGECLPDIEVLLKLGQVFGKSVEELLLIERVYGEPVIDEVMNTKIEVLEQLDVWTKALDKIKSKISISSFNTWFKSTKAECVEKTYLIYSSNNFTTEWLYQRYTQFIMQILEEITGESDFKIEFRSMDKSSINFVSSRILDRVSLRLS